MIAQGIGSKMRFLLVFGSLAGVALLVLVLIFPGTRAPETSPQGVVPGNSAPYTPQAGSRGSAAADSKSPPSPDLSADGEAHLLVWERRIDETIEDASLTDAEVRARMLTLTEDVEAPAEVKADALEHALTLTTDEEWGIFARRLARPRLDPSLRDLIWLDMHDRDENVQFSACLAILRVGNHPLSEEARDFLEIALGEDLGEDVAAWENAVASATVDDGEGSGRKR